MRRTWRVVPAVLVVMPFMGCGEPGGDAGEPEVLAEAELNGIPGDVAAGDGAVWIAVVGDGGGLQMLETDNLGERTFLEVSGGADAVAVGDDTLWALTAASGTVTSFDRDADEDDEGTAFDIEIDSSDFDYDEVFEDLDARGEVAYAVGVLGLRRMTAGGGVIAPPEDDEYEYGEDVESDLEYEDVPVVATSDAVWAVTEDDGLTRFDPDTLEPFDDPTGPDAATLATDGEVVWSVTDDGTVSRHEEGFAPKEIAVLEDRFPDDEYPEAIVYADDTLWVVAAGELIRLDPESGDEIGESLMLPGGTEEAGYAISRGPDDDTVVVVQRPTHKVWLVG